MADTTTAPNSEFANCIVNVLADGTVSVKGQVLNPDSWQKMEVYASNPINSMTSYSGSGLPFPCAAVAFDNTPNYYLVAKDGAFDVRFLYPNGFLTTDAFSKVPPSVFIKLTAAGIQPIQLRYVLADPLPLRTLVNRPHHSLGPIFYSAKEDVVPIATAEQTMINIAAAKVKYDIAS